MMNDIISTNNLINTPATLEMSGSVTKHRRLDMNILAHKRSGIYQIINTTNGHRYIGSAVDLYHRQATHISKLKKNQHGNPHLQSAFIKHGEDCFVFSVLEYCENEALIEREQYWIDSLLPEYNIRKKAESNLGIKFSEESSLKKSIAMLGRKVSDETKKKLSAIFKGRPIPHEQRAKISATLTGRKGHAVSSETRLKLSALFSGRPLTHEQKEKLSKAHTGKKLSQEHKDNISASLLGKNKGRIVSDEVRKKLSEIGKTKTGSNSNVARSVCQYSKSGVLINSYSCAAEAERIMGINKSNIGECCKGYRNNAGGYIWRYADEVNNV